jgi:hypothetical protein
LKGIKYTPHLKCITLALSIFIYTFSNAQWIARIDGSGTATITTNTAYIASSNGNPYELTGFGITSSGTQPVYFTFSFNTSDPTFDKFYYSIDGVRTIITATNQAGTISLTLTNGRNFFFGIDNDDGCCGHAEVSISNLTPPQGGYLQVLNPTAQLTSNCTVLAPSAPTTFDVTGSYLASTVTVSATTGFEISASQNSGYASSLSLTPDGSGTVSSTLYVRLTAGSGGGISGTITASSIGATTQTTTVSSTTVAPPAFSPAGPFNICAEASYLVALASPNSYNGWSNNGSSIFSVNSMGYITTVAPGTASITYTDACGQSVSQTVIVQSASPSIPLVDNNTAYKHNGSPQGPLSGGATINYAGYDGYSYLSQTRPSNVGFYKANIQSGNQAGCPNRFYIFTCAICDGYR